MNAWEKFKTYYEDKGFMEQLGLFRYEDANTNFLASVLKEDNIYGYKLKPMELFLALIYEKESNYFKDRISNVDIKLREVLDSGTPDMIITCEVDNKKVLILIEAKLFSKEHDDQCKNYYNDIEREYKETYQERKYVYLTLDGSKSSAEEKYINITYQALVSNLYDKLDDNKKVALTVKEYLKSFNAFYNEDILITSSWKYIPVAKDAYECVIKLFNYFNRDVEEIKKLTRNRIVKYIENIFIHEDKSVEINFKEDINSI